MCNHDASFHTEFWCCKTSRLCGVPRRGDQSNVPENTEAPTCQETQNNIKTNCALWLLCCSRYVIVSCISLVRGLALACRPSDSRISCKSDCLLASGISSALRSDGTLEAVTQPVANRLRSGNGCVGQLGKLSGVERSDFFDREFWVRACQRSSVVDKFSFDQADFHDASPPSSSSAAVVPGCACGANSEGASGSRETGVAAGAAGVVGLLALDGFEVFLRASSRAALAAASISALADARVVCSCRRSEEHTSELQSLRHLVCRLLL